MHGITRAALTLGLGLGLLGACTDGRKANEIGDRDAGVTAGPGTSGAPQGGGTAAATGGGVGGAAAAPAPGDSAAAAGATDTTRRDSLAPRPQ